MRRNFPRPYTTTYLRVVVVGQLVALADSEITAILLVVLTGWVPSLSTPSVSRSLSMPFRISLARANAPVGLASPCSINSCLLAGICLCTSLGVCGRCRIRTCVTLSNGSGLMILSASPCCCFASRPIYQIFRGIAFRFLFENQRTSQRAGRKVY